MPSLIFFFLIFYTIKITKMGGTFVGITKLPLSWKSLVSLVKEEEGTRKEKDRVTDLEIGIGKSKSSFDLLTSN